MLDAMRKYVEAGRETLTPKKAEDLARSLVRQGQARREQASKLARDLAEWSRKNSERLGERIRSEVKNQISRSGLATKDEVESLKRRIRDLEKRGGAKAATAKPKSTKSTASKSTAAKSTTARKRTT